MQVNVDLDELVVVSSTTTWVSYQVPGGRGMTGKQACLGWYLTPGSIPRSALL